MIDFSNAPKMSGETATWKSKPASRKDLKTTNQAWSGYGISNEEIIVFPTEAQLNQAIKEKKDVLRIRETSSNSKRFTAFILVERIKNDKSSTNWFNMSALSRPCRDAAGKRYYSTDFMEEMSMCPDDDVRLDRVLGKAIMGVGIESAYQQKFDKDTRKPIYKENGDPEMEPYEYVQVELCEVPGADDTDTADAADAADDGQN